MFPLIKNWRTTSERIDKFISDKYFIDVNITKMINVETLKVTDINHFNKSTNPYVSTKESLHLFDNSAFTFNDVISFENDWQQIDVATFTFGPTWSVHWFRVEFSVPKDWAVKGADHIIELQWNSGCEVLLFSVSGHIIQGLNATHVRTSVDICLLPSSTDNKYIVYLQASCSDLFGAGKGGLINPPATDKTFRIELAQLALLFRPALTLGRDLRLLSQIAECLKETERGYQALYVANEAVNCVVELRCDDLAGKIAKAQCVVDAFFRAGNGRPKRLSLHAMGHCHIDTAWLWRYGETRRKIARSWATTLRLLEKYPQMTFVCSQAQQLDWLREDYPSLFVQLQAAGHRNQFIPVGGTWVEMDVNLPCCESLCRQFLYGQRFFRDNFGHYCREFWLPDTFGYSPQLPQIMRQSRITRFVTQKLSWSLVNKFPHHTFLWEGLDGSTVLTHFPPGDSYAMTGCVSEVLHSGNNFADKGRSSVLMYLYGHGDGGQGPTEEMLHTVDRLSDCDGLPKICHSSPGDMFSQVEAEGVDKLCRWKGELFLELHNGTYTTQRQLKLGNAHCEQMLRAVELLLCIALCQSESNHGDGPINGQLPMIMSAIETQWKMVLLGQFHDVLPGSSIELVCDDAYWSHRSVLSWCASTIGDLASLFDIPAPFGINPTSWRLDLPMSSATDTQRPSSRCSFRIPPLSIGCCLMTADVVPKVEYSFDGDTQLHRLANRYFRITVDKQCRISCLQLVSAPAFSNIFPDGDPANQLVMYDDVPLYWDAWDVMDYHLETGANIDSLPSFRLSQEAVLAIDTDSMSLVAKFSIDKTGTVIEQSISVHPDLPYIRICTKVVEWHENHHMIKVKIPTVANVVQAQYRTQAGYQTRPTHRNTSWDSAKFEVCSHEWIHIGEANWGVSVLKDSLFGSSVDGGTIYLSLLRSPTSPDISADKKHLPHIFNYAIYPHDSSADSDTLATTSRLAAQFTWMTAWNSSYPNEVAPGSLSVIPDQCKSFPIKLESPTGGEISIDWIKPSCDDLRKFVIRLHEQIGGRYLTKLSSSLPIKCAAITDILEESEPLSSDVVSFTRDSVELFMLPFKIISIIVEFV